MIRRILRVFVTFLGGMTHFTLTYGGVEFFDEILAPWYYRREFLALAWGISFFWPFVVYLFLNAEAVNKLNENIRLTRKVEELERELREERRTSGLDS